MEIKNEVKNYNVSKQSATNVGEANTSATSTKKNTESLVTISNEAKMLHTSSKNKNINADKTELPRYLLSPEKTPTANWQSGNVYDFLNANDKAVLQKAYDYATENNLEHRDVARAAYDLAGDRMVEAMKRSGVLYSVHVQEDKDFVFVSMYDDPSLIKTKGEKIKTESENESLLKTMRDKLFEGKLFADNPVLNQALFLQPVINKLNLDEKELSQLLNTLNLDEKELFQPLDIASKFKYKNEFTSKQQDIGYYDKNK